MTQTLVSSWTDFKDKLTYKNEIKMETTIGTIGNYYGGLSVMKNADKFYWGIENYDGTEWEEITEELYNNLISFEEKRSKDEES